MTNRFAGIDIGSRTIELVVIDETDEIVESFQTDTGFDPMAEAKRLVDGVAFDRIMATGYGRNLFEIAFDAATVTEIKAHAVGARALFPDIQAIIDIGGQDSKAIALFENGRVRKFEMNDRCAAGTGKFLEIMARTLTAHIALVKAADYDSLEFRSIFACGITLYLFTTAAVVCVRMLDRQRK